MTNNLTTGYYIGNFYQIDSNSNDNLSVPVNKENLKSVFDKGFKRSEMEVGFVSESINNTPVDFHATISKTSEGNYQAIGEMSEFLQSEEDFDSKEDFEEYLSYSPDGLYDIDFEFTGKDLEEVLSEYHQLNTDIDSSESAAVIVYGLFILSKNNIQ